MHPVSSMVLYLFTATQVPDLSIGLDTDPFIDSLHAVLIQTTSHHIIFHLESWSNPQLNPPSIFNNIQAHEYDLAARCFISRLMGSYPWNEWDTLRLLYHCHIHGTSRSSSKSRRGVGPLFNASVAEAVTTWVDRRWITNRLVTDGAVMLRILDHLYVLIDKFLGVFCFEVEFFKLFPYLEACFFATEVFKLSPILEDCCFALAFCELYSHILEYWMHVSRCTSN
jgi:hypothetical protein